MPRTLLTSLVGVIATVALWTTSGSAQRPTRLLYAAAPGILGNNVNYGGVGILIFDIDAGHKFVRRVPLQGSIPGPNARGIVPVEAILGVAAHAPTARLYLSTNDRIAAYDLLTDKLVWEKNYEQRGIDRVALSPDGKTLYAPAVGGAKWFVVDARTGAIITAIDVRGRAHNTLFSHDGGRVYLESQGDTRVMSVADTKTHTIVKTIGPFGNVVRPFTIDGRETLLFANLNGLLGFEVADLTTGKVIHRVEVPDAPIGTSARHGATPSHGIGMTQDETEVWVVDGPNHALRIFDATAMPQTLKTSIKLRDEPGWITFGIDGRLVYPSTGDVVEARTKQIVATLQDENGQNVQTEKMIEIDFANGKPTQAANQFATGMKR